MNITVIRSLIKRQKQKLLSVYLFFSEPLGKDMQYCRLSCAARCWHTNDSLKFKWKINVKRLPTIIIIDKAVVLNSADVHEIEQIYTLPVTAEETAKETKADTELNNNNKVYPQLFKTIDVLRAFF